MNKANALSASEVSDVGMPLPELIRRLVDVGGIKVWSLAVTVIGDYATTNTQQSALSGQQLNTLFECMGIKPETLRVALHRLRNESWIATEKSGRNSYYGLSPIAIRETQAVSEIVYVPNFGTCTEWQVVVLPNTTSITSEAKIKLSPQSYLVKGYSGQEGFVLPLAAASWPEWVEERLLVEGLGDLARQLNSILTDAESIDLQTADPVDLAALRALSLHHWRRIALRQAAWLHMQQFDTGVIKECHNTVHRLLHKIPALYIA